MKGHVATRRRKPKDGTEQIPSGLIKCADCGGSLGYGRRKKRDGYDGYYHCSKNGQGLRQCLMHNIRFDNLFAKLYENWTTGRITAYNFNMLYEKYQGEQQELDEKMTQLNADMCSEQQSVEDACKWLALIRQYANLTELDADRKQSCDLINACFANKPVRSSRRLARKPPWRSICG